MLTYMKATEFRKQFFNSNISTKFSSINQYETTIKKIIMFVLFPVLILHNISI